MPNFTVGDIVTVKGYGGMAEVLMMEEDGVTPQGHPKYLCTVRFGPNDEMHDKLHVDLPFGPTRKRSRDRVHQFYAGKLKNILDIDDDDEPTTTITEAQERRHEEAAAKRKEKLREIAIEMAILQAEMDEE